MEWWIWILIVAGAAAVCAAAVVYWNNVIRVVKYDCENEKLPEAFDGFTIAHVSDFHNKNYGRGARRVADKIAAAHPDVIVISGDMIQTEKTNHALALTASLTKIAPVYYVNGNHEKYVAGYPAFKEAMTAQGVRVLENQTEVLRRGDAQIFLSGVVDPRFYTGERDERIELFYENVKALTREDGYNVLLSHRPEFMRAYVEAGVDLVLAGHAHAGQVRLPFVGAIFTPGEKFKPHYDVGRFTEKNTTMIVSGGLGSSNPVPRIFNRPQLLFETLKSGKTALQTQDNRAIIDETSVQRRNSEHVQDDQL